MGGMKPGMMMVLNKASQYERMPRNEYGREPGRRMIGFDRDYSAETRRGYDEGKNRMGNYMPYDGLEPESRRMRDYSGNATTSNYGGSPYGYEPEMPHMGGYGGGPEARRRRDSRGRYMMGGMDYDDDESQYYSPQMRGGGSKYGFGDVYASIQAPGAMNRPGMMGGMESDMSAPVDEHTARMWVQKMDGGEHFKLEQTEQQRMTVCPDCDRFEWYVAMNAMYSDYCETAKKMNIDRPDYYAHLAKDFLKDKDAKPHKLRRYMEHIAK